MNTINLVLAIIVFNISGLALAEQPANMDDPVIKEFVSAQSLPVPDRIFKYAEACVKYKDLALHLPKMVQVSCLKRLSVLQGMSIQAESQVGSNTLSELEVAVGIYFVVLTGK